MEWTWRGEPERSGGGGEHAPPTPGVGRILGLVAKLLNPVVV